MKQKTKVLHIITRLIIGGAQDNTLLTLEGHDRNKFEIHLVSHPCGAWAERAKLVSDHFHSVTDLVHPLNLFKDVRCLIALIRLIQREKIDIVHTHSSKAGILGRLAAGFAKVPIVVHTVHGFAFHGFMPAWKRQFYIFLERLVVTFTSFFITVSELNRKEAIQLKLMSESNSQTVYSGISFSHIDQTSEASEVRQRLSLKPDEKIILMVGRLDQQKAPYYLVSAFSKVIKQHPKTRLILVGDGVLRPSLETQVKDLSLTQNVQFLGSRQDVPDILSICDIFALSSLWEGLGRAMTEAMLVSKPVVVPEIYGIPEIVHHDETGLLYPAGDVDKLAEHLIYLLDNPKERDRLGKNAKALTRCLFSADKMVKDIEEIYDQLLSRNHEKNTQELVAIS